MRWLVFVITLHYGTHASAEVKYEPQVIPKCTVTKLSSGRLACTYDLKQMMAIYRADSELAHSRSELKVKDEKLRLYSSMLAATQQQLKLALNNDELLQKRVVELTEQIIKLDRDYQEERVKPRWGTWASWGATAIMAAILGGYIVADQVSR